MRTHQKYFSCLNPDGTPAPRFLFVANNLTPDAGKTIAAGNERVLRARLSDARFFWDQDRKMPLENRVGTLGARIYHQRLSNMFDKVGRMERLAGFLSAYIPGAQEDRSRRAAWLSKADLSTGMVGEFPELQGIMGRYYALQGDKKEDRRVADAIADHYKPIGVNDECPEAPDGVAVALSDKIDALVGFFAIQEIPTGSRDPFALRRAAQGVIRIILEKALRIRLVASFDAAVDGYRQIVPLGLEARIILFNQLLEFIADRLKVHLREQGVGYELVSAVFARFGAAAVPTTHAYDDDLVRVLARLRALVGFLDSDNGANLLTAFRRASNIVNIEDRRDGYARNLDVDPDWLKAQEERTLYDALNFFGSEANKLVAEEKFEDAMAVLASLRQPIDEFFDKVTVNVSDPKLRENRLRLLARIRATMNQVADFSQIEG
jgi:glycyl-tRNA synthetase beta chain